MTRKWVRFFIRVLLIGFAISIQSIAFSDMVSDKFCETALSQLSTTQTLQQEERKTIIEQYENILSASVTTSTSSGGIIAINLRIKQLEKRMHLQGMTVEEISEIRLRTLEQIQKTVQQNSDIIKYQQDLRSQLTEDVGDNPIWILALEIMEKIKSELNEEQRKAIGEEFKAIQTDPDKRLLHRKAWTFVVNLLTRPDVERHPELVIQLLDWLRYSHDALLLHDVVNHFALDWTENREELLPVILPLLEREPNKQDLNIFAAKAFLKPDPSNEKWIEQLIQSVEGVPQTNILASLANAIMEPGISNDLFDKWLAAALNMDGPRFTMEAIFKFVIPNSPRFKDPQYLNRFIRNYYRIPQEKRDEYSVIRNAMMGNPENLQNDILLRFVIDNAIQAEAIQTLNFFAEMFAWNSFAEREGLLRYLSEKAYGSEIAKKITMYTGPLGHLPKASKVKPGWIAKSQWNAAAGGVIQPGAPYLGELIKGHFENFTFKEQKQLILDFLKICKKENNFKELKVLTHVVFNKTDFGGHTEAFAQFIEVVNQAPPKERSEIMNELVKTDLEH